MDFREVFDKLNRRILIYKLLRNGLSTKSVAMVKSIYSSVRLRVKAGGVLSDALDNLLGVKQREPLFPFLFLFFNNDIIDDISTDTAGGIVSLNEYLIYLFYLPMILFCLEKHLKFYNICWINYSYIAANRILKLTLTKPK